MKRSDKKTIAVILTAAALLVLAPLFVLKEAEFTGSDESGSQAVEAMESEYQPWFSPVLETVIGREIPGEVETLMFCFQTGIGVGIIAFLMGRFVERKKWENGGTE